MVKNKIIYIMSVGHSGSTLLDITLGQFKNSFSTGELKHLTWQYYRQITNDPKTQKCTCGANFDECKVWLKVINDLAEKKDIGIQKVPNKIPIKHFDSLSFFANHKKDKLIKALYKYNLSYSLLPNSLFKFFLKKVNENNILLYNSIFNHLPEVDYIIDSSKDIIRFHELNSSKTKRITFFPIVLIRDIYKIMKSKYINTTRKKMLKFWKTYYNKYILPILKTLNENQFHIISYEMFVNNPYREIEKLTTKLNLNMNNFDTEFSMRNYHLVAGNPMRYNEKIEIWKRQYEKEMLIDSLRKAKLDNFFIDKIAI